MAFDFFNISGSLFVETNTDPKKFQRKGLFMMMTKFWCGFEVSGWAIDKYFTKSFNNTNGQKRTKMIEFVTGQGKMVGADGLFSKVI
jgi:NHS family xanthosine MFS transporter